MDTPRPLLTRLRAENVRSFARLDLELGPLTVLVGPNGAGKSNVVELLRFLRDASAAGLAEALARQRGWASFCRNDSLLTKVEAILEVDQSILNYSVRLTEEYGAIRVLHERLEISGAYEADIFLRGGVFGSSLDSLAALGRGESDLSLVRPNGLVSRLHDPHDRTGPDDDAALGVAQLHYRAFAAVRDVLVYNPAPSILRDQIQRTDSAYVLKEDLSNLGAILLAIRETPFGDEVDRALALLVDGVTAYRVLQAGSTLVPQILYGPDDARNLDLESDGTIRLVAILAALYQPVPPSLIVLEEPEMGLHPGVLGALAEIIDEATLRMQVLVTTHSPDLIDRFDPDVIRIVEKVNGESVIGRVDPEQRDLIHKRLYRPSELMRIRGLVREPG